ncbi:MAG: low molecular weight protein arginine phosphatase [Gemmatimonadota bacterium]|nr:low molecular weight protein arginine phosphatase [Gemmatimonadota bacterium]
MNILFVCTGNTCRSPLAEAFAKSAAARRGIPNFTASSAGTNAWDGSPASDGALLVGLERGTDLGAHRSRKLTREMIAAADLVLVMSPAHLESVRELGGGGKAHLIDEYGSDGKSSDGVSDPFGGALDGYRDAADSLQRAIEGMFDRLSR